MHKNFPPLCPRYTSSELRTPKPAASFSIRAHIFQSRPIAFRSAMNVSMCSNSGRCIASRCFFGRMNPARSFCSSSKIFRSFCCAKLLIICVQRNIFNFLSRIPACIFPRYIRATTRRPSFTDCACILLQTSFHLLISLCSNRSIAAITSDKKSIGVRPT